MVAFNPEAHFFLTQQNTPQHILAKKWFSTTYLKISSTRCSKASPFSDTTCKNASTCSKKKKGKELISDNPSHTMTHNYKSVKPQQHAKQVMSSLPFL